MAQNATKEIEGAAFAAKRVAIALGRRRDLSTYSIRFQPRSAAKVHGRATHLWLSDVSFFVSSSPRSCFVVGKVLASRPRKVRSADWTEVGCETSCFYEVSTERFLRGAKYVRLENAKAYVMGPEYGNALTSVRDMNPGSGPLSLRTYNPDRSSWTGDMGGINYVPPAPEEISRTLEEIWDAHPGAVVIDGTDDWFAPQWARPELFAEMFSIEVLALWHTGASGKSTSGIVLAQAEYVKLSRAFRNYTTYNLEDVPSQRQPDSHSTCGCWDGSAFRIYHDPHARPGTWEAP